MVDPSTHTQECVRCDADYMWALYLLSQYVPLTLLFVLVVVSDIRVTSAPANAFIFFAQVLPTVFTLNGGGAIMLRHPGNHLADAYSYLYNIWNLMFLHQRICLSPNLSSLGAISITYLEAVYPLILIGIVRLFIWLYETGFHCIVCICRPLHITIARFQQYLNIQRSLIHTFAAFILLSYSRLILVSFLLMTTTPLVAENGGKFGDVAFYDGNIPYLSTSHAIFVLLSSTFLVIFVVVTPLLLIFPSVARNCTVIRNQYPKIGRFLPNCDRFSITCWPRLTTFLDAFHKCYKDGTSTNNSMDFDFRWFAGFYVILRIALFGVHAFARDWFEQYTSLQFVCIAGLLAFLLLHPYKDDYYNKLDSTKVQTLGAISERIIK